MVNKFMSSVVMHLLNSAEKFFLVNEAQSFIINVLNILLIVIHDY